jgi:penicillin-binding protein 1A
MPERHLRRRPVPRRALRGSVRVAVILAIGIPLLVGSAAAAGFGALLYGDLPGTVPQEHTRVISQPSYAYDINGQQIATFRKFDLNIPMTQADVPQVLKDAVVASEDHKFWTHKGVDPAGLVRAAVTNYRQGATVQGGSTITQQYVKNTYLSDEKSVERKLNEAVLATRLERDLTQQLGSQRAAKEEILYRYLNTTYFGSGAYGVAAAAQSYFRTDVKDLSISQAAALVAIIPAPSKYGPRDDWLKSEERREEVLLQMRDQGMISDAQYADAKSKFLWNVGLADPGRPTTPVYPPPDNGASKYPWFVDYVRSYVTDKFGDKGQDLLYRGGLRIDTTIDPKLQNLADLAVGFALAGVKADPEGHQPDMSLVSIDPTSGYVKAMVGGRDFAQSQLNLAISKNGFQPGSSMKPYTMAVALEQGITPDTVYPPTTAWLQPSALCRAAPATKGCVIHGEAASTMGPAIAESSNTYFAQLANDVGPNNIAKLANAMGVRDTHLDQSYYINITLGTNLASPLDQAVGYSTFENHGVRQDPTPVTRITDPHGTVLEDNRSRAGTKVLNAAIADTVTDLMRGPVVAGTASKALADFGRPAAGKTGTTDDNTNAWFVGYTPQLTTAVWLGHPDGNYPLAGVQSGPVFGGTIPALTWKSFMKPALDGLPVLDFPVPGPLPPPGSGTVLQADPQSPDQSLGGLAPTIRGAQERTIPDLATDCGGPCIVGGSPSLPPPAPPTTLLPPSTTTTTTAPTTTTTTKKGHGP